MGRGPVRLREVAEAAGVTVSTASRALNRPELVRPETRERVAQAARLLGYVPNRMARAIVTGRSETIVFVIPDLSLGLFHTVAAAAQREARRRKLDLLVADSMGSSEREAGLVESARGYAEGIILLWPQADYEPEDGDPPVVTIGRQVRGAHAVLLDQSHVLETQVAHLRRLGHERILYVDGLESYGAARERRRFAERLAADLPLELSDPFEMTFEGGVALADSLDPSITAVIAFIDNQALGIIQRLAERGIRVPEDVSVIGNNDVMWARMTNPALTTLHTPYEAMGRAAVSLLLDTERPGDGAQIVETFRSELVERRSTAPPRR